MKKLFRAKVIGKWIKKGIIFKTPMFGLEFENLIPKHMDIKIATMAYWYSVEVGTMIDVPFFYDSEDQKWYVDYNAKPVA
jgi:hypothetical protein